MKYGGLYRCPWHPDCPVECEYSSPDNGCAYEKELKKNMTKDLQKVEWNDMVQ